MKKFYTLLLSLAVFGLSLSATAQETYIITGFPSIYFLEKEDGTPLYESPVIQNLIDMVRLKANEVDCIIQLGDNITHLDLDDFNATLITFKNTTTETWGKVTLTGKAKAKCTTTDGIDLIKNYISLEWKANILETSFNYFNIFHNYDTLTISNCEIYSSEGKIYNEGTLTINGGDIQLTWGAIGNEGTTNINGGTIFSNGNFASAVYNSPTGILNICGGTVEATNGAAIYNYGGTVNISGGTVTSSAEGSSGVITNYDGIINIVEGNITATYAGIAIYNSFEVPFKGSGGTANINGGNITAENGSAIFNQSSCYVNINGGLISSIGEDAIRNTGIMKITGGIVRAQYRNAVFNFGGTITVNGGILFAYGERETDVVDNIDFDNITDDAVLVAWDEANSYMKVYQAGTNLQLYNFPAEAIVFWDIKDTIPGITVKYRATNDFIPVGVTIYENGVKPITNGELQITVYPNPTTGQLTMDNGQLTINNVEVFDVYGKKLLSSPVSFMSPETSIDISNFSNGIYLLKITTETGIITKKVIKN